MVKTVPLQKRGQFVTHEGLPIEDVCFLSNDGFEAVAFTTQANCTSPKIVWRKSDTTGRVGTFREEEFKTTAFALRRLANILEGKITFEEFATQPSQKPQVSSVVVNGKTFRKL